MGVVGPNGNSGAFCGDKNRLSNSDVELTGGLA